MFRTTLPVVLLAVGTALGGCLFVSGSETTIAGAYVAKEDLFNIRPGQTTQDDVRRTLGPPTSSATLDNGSERWVYRWTEEKESGGAIFLIFAGGSEKTIFEQVAITFVGGVVESIERQ